MDYRAVKGKNFRSSDLARWGEAQYITFLRYCEQFFVPTEYGPKYSNTNALWLKSEEVLTMSEHPFIEFLWRNNYFSTDKNSSFRKFFAKHLTMMNMVLKFIQRNPSVVTDDMRKILEMYPNFRWALTQTAVVPTALGTEVVIPKAGIAPFEQQLYEAGVKVVDILKRLADSITDSDIKKMTPRDKMIAMGRMGYIFTLAKNIKPNKQIFKQLNIVAASREDLEKSLLEFAQKE